MENFFEHETCEASYIKEKHRMFFKYNGYINLEETKNMYLKALELMKSHKTVSFLNDVRKMQGTFTGINAWLVENLQETISLGLRYDAMILNNDVFTAYATKDFSKMLTSLELQIFKSMEEAEAWLDSKGIS